MHDPHRLPVRTENEYVYVCGNVYENGGDGERERERGVRAGVCSPSRARRLCAVLSRVVLPIGVGLGLESMVLSCSPV